MTVFFYSHNRGQFACFSNFYPVEFVDSNGMRYNCSEQYFMKKKQELFDPLNHKLAERIMEEDDPAQIKRLGRRVRNFDQEVWTERRYEVMRDALTLKFSQNPLLRQALLSTGTKLLVEASPSDSIWGIGLSAKDAERMSPDQWPGLNLLGKALDEVRTRVTVISTEQ